MTKDYKRVIIVHGWSGNPNYAWFLWLKNELVKRGIEVLSPQMPDANFPAMEKWIPHLAKIVGKPDSHTYFVGHSIGCQTIIRYLESLPQGTTVGGVVLVAGFAKSLTGLAPEDWPIAKPWMETPINWSKVKPKTSKWIAIHSDNDLFVPLDNAAFFEEKLQATVIIQHKKGHFSEGDTHEIPVVLDELLKMAA